jgi:hypothetical protein
MSGWAVMGRKAKGFGAGRSEATTRPAAFRPKGCLGGQGPQAPKQKQQRQAQPVCNVREGSSPAPEILRRLHIRYAPTLDQAHRLSLNSRVNFRRSMTHLQLHQNT